MVGWVWLVSAKGWFCSCCVCLCYNSGFFTLNRSFYPSTSSTRSSVRADSPILMRRDTSSVVTKVRHIGDTTAVRTGRKNGLMWRTHTHTYRTVSDPSPSFSGMLQLRTSLLFFFLFSRFGCFCHGYGLIFITRVGDYFNLVFVWRGTIVNRTKCCQ